MKIDNNDVPREERRIPLFWIIIGVLSVIFLVVSIMGLHQLLIDYLLLSIATILLLRFTVILVIKRRISVDLLMATAGIATWYLHAIQRHIHQQNNPIN